jgi:D-alanyl-D-alanine carboxypeptidase (penicillin-binding protein 5/6)
MHVSETARRAVRFVTILAVLLWAGGGLAMVALAPPAQALETAAQQLILIDAETGAVLLEKDADSPMPPASMSKLMTLYMVFERLDDGSLSLEDTLPVSEKAWRKGGSKMFVKVNSRVTVEDLLRGIIIQSGNDASIVVAEGLSGSEETFAAEMNESGRELGFTNTNFINSSGWPAPDHFMSPRDLATLSRAIINKFPRYYLYFAEKSFTYNGIRQGNRNPLLYKDLGADGLKTGHTKEAGYGLAASAVRNGRRLILVFNGTESVNQRAREAELLLEWGFREFDNYTLFEAGDTADEAEVWLGREASVPLVIKNELTLTMARKARRDMSVKVVYDTPIPAPIQAGEELATLIVTAPEIETIVVPLYAGASISQLGLFGRVKAAVGYLLWGASGN